MEEENQQSNPDQPLSSSSYSENFLASVNLVLEHEGGYSNHPMDKGGPTNMGITLNTLSVYRGRPCTAWDVQMLTKSEAIAIYHKLYWSPMKLDLIPDQNLVMAVFNQGVLRGTVTAIKSLQRVVGATADGKLGPITAGRVKSYGYKEALRDFLQAAQHAFIDICVSNPSQIVFLRGWINRTHDLWDRLLRVG